MSRAAVLAFVVGLAGCLFPSPPAPPRYFAPADPPAASEAGDAGPPVAVRLGVVRSPVHLREQITWRRSDVEYGFYEQRRWTELPATYVERALAHELFGDGRAAVPVRGDAPVVTATVQAFEEVLAPVHAARVELAIVVSDARCVLLRGTFAASRPLDGDDPVALARSIGAALDEVARSAVDAIRAAVGAHPTCTG